MKTLSNIWHFAGSVVTLLTATALVTTSCNETSLDEDIALPLPDNMQKISVEVGMGVNDDSRVSVTNGTDAWKVEWQAGDKLGGWSRTTQEGFEDFTMKDMTADSNGKYCLASFFGNIYPASDNTSITSLRLVYPYDGTSAISNGIYNIDLSTQSNNGTSAYASMKDYMYMISPKLLTGVASTIKDATLSHLTAMLQLNLTLTVPTPESSKATYRLLSVEIGGGDGTNAVATSKGASLDLMKSISESDFMATTSGAYTIYMEGMPTISTNSEISVLAAVLPFTYSHTIPLNVVVYVEKTDGTTVTVQKQTLEILKKSEGNATVAAGTFNTITRSYDLDALADAALTTWLGKGTQNNPYKIYNRADLALLATTVNAGAKQGGNYFRLMNDIDLGDSATPWTRIGYDTDDSTKLFEGTFDGAGHTISGLYMMATDDQNAGLFGAIGSSGKVKNLSVSGTVNAGNYGYIGGIAGYNAGSITNCSFSGSVSGNEYIGGIAGYNNNNSIIANCYNTGEVLGKDYVGGIAGYNLGTITNCYNTGSVSGDDHLGGIAGSNYKGKITNCYNTGNVLGNESSFLGGIAGSNDNDKITNCYNLENTCLNATNTDGTLLMEATAMKTADFVTTLNTNAVTYNKTSNVSACAWVAGGPSPMLSFGEKPLAAAPTDTWEAAAAPNFGGGTGDETNPYRITSAQELAHLAAMQSTSTPETNWSTGKYFVLMNDIDLSDKLWTQIGDESHDTDTDKYYKEFEGIFDGAGHTISGLYMTATDDLGTGLFGAIGSSGTVKNLAVSGTVNGGSHNYIGGIAGNNYGTTTNCSFSGSVSAKNYVGSIAGYNDGTITNCYNTGSISGSSNVGGIVGYNLGTITNCYNIDTVSGTDSYVGGIAGYYNSTDNKITYCYYLGSSCTSTDSGTSKIAAKMQETTFADTLNNWVDTNINTYPNACKWKQVAGCYPTLAY